ncbi:HAD-IA family hydrolase [Curvibacter sp. HBC61]|uniref:HAD-IA family hydrolase n=1 Tax=Curvibacter cyanobacteriorum TaxID=3026422 RepID=A0ABT5N245_9BURK|nr:HAD-IA family hydrolase [Curvibacter sp. HBC61]MDD0839122.1 HAD-IA family hydrolase [Curvibacter sp. HBC61]
MLEALIFDVDGTLADTEAAHRAAFNDAFDQVRLGWYWDEATYLRLLQVSGGKERIAHHWRMVEPDVAEGRAAQTVIERVHAIKTRLYEDRVSGGQLALRPGVLRLLREALNSKLRLAIATTTTPTNIDALLRTPLGPDWRRYFAAIGDASTAPRKKPDPLVYQQALTALGLPASACLAFEDSANGLRAASAAGLPTVVTPTAYTANHRFDDALCVLPHLGDAGALLPCGTAGMAQRWVTVDALRRWHADATLCESA